MKETSFPRLDACLTLYRAAYDKHGMDAFAATDLELDGMDAKKSHVLDLATAYGLLSVEAGAYRVTCTPDATDEEWAEVADSQTARIHRAVTTRLNTPGVSGDRAAERNALTYEGTEYASVQIEESDGFDAVIDGVGSVEATEWDGVVLCAPGEYANEVQRFADRLGEESTESDPLAGTTFTKEYSDVTGESKNELEYLVFLSFD